MNDTKNFVSTSFPLEYTASEEGRRLWFASSRLKIDTSIKNILRWIRSQRIQCSLNIIYIGYNINEFNSYTPGFKSYLRLYFSACSFYTLFTEQYEYVSDFITCTSNTFLINNYNYWMLQSLKTNKYLNTCV